MLLQTGAAYVSTARIHNYLSVCTNYNLYRVILLGMDNVESRESDGYLVAAKVQTDTRNSCPQNAGQTEKKASYEILRKYGRLQMKQNFIHQ